MSTSEFPTCRLDNLNISSPVVDFKWPLLNPVTRDFDKRLQEPGSSLGQTYHLHLQPCNLLLPLGVHYWSANGSKLAMNKFRLEITRSFLIMRAVNIWKDLLNKARWFLSLWAFYKAPWLPNSNSQRKYSDFPVVKMMCVFFTHTCVFR